MAGRAPRQLHLQLQNFLSTAALGWHARYDSRSVAVSRPSSHCRFAGMELLLGPVNAVALSSRAVDALMPNSGNPSLILASNPESQSEFSPHPSVAPALPASYPPSDLNSAAPCRRRAVWHAALRSAALLGAMPSRAKESIREGNTRESTRAGGGHKRRKSRQFGISPIEIVLLRGDGAVDQEPMHAMERR